MCPDLAPFHASIEQFVYHGQRQDDRYSNASHSWQGGPVARSWLEGKYWILPKAKTSTRIYEKIGQIFLSQAQNQQFVNDLDFSVTSTGYQAPRNPSDMQDMPEGL